MMTKDMFKSLLDSMLQCICDLWDAADSPEKKQLLVQKLEELVGQLSVLQDSSNFTSGGAVSSLEGQSISALPSMSTQAREMLSVILTATGLLEKYELQMEPERRAEEFKKIRDAIQSFARLLDEEAI